MGLVVRAENIIDKVGLGKAAAPHQHKGDGWHLCEHQALPYEAFAFYQGLLGAPSGPGSTQH